MEKSGLYNRQGILMRKNCRTVDKNHTLQTVEETKAKARDTRKKNTIGSYHNYLRVNHFGTKDEKKMQQAKLKQEADLQFRLREQQRTEERRKNQAEDRHMLNHLKRELERDAESQRQKRQALQKISQENKQAAMFKKNITKLNAQEDQAVARKAAMNHDLGFKIRF